MAWVGRLDLTGGEVQHFGEAVSAVLGLVVGSGATLVVRSNRIKTIFRQKRRDGDGDMIMSGAGVSIDRSTHYGDKMAEPTREASLVLRHTGNGNSWLVLVNKGGEPAHALTWRAVDRSGIDAASSDAVFDIQPDDKLRLLRSSDRIASVCVRYRSGREEAYTQLRLGAPAVGGE
jgi:hypothetical protein